MQIDTIKSKIHLLNLLGADLNYIGSITADEVSMDAANIIEAEKIQAVNNPNKECLKTYTIPILMAYAFEASKEAKTLSPN